MIGNATYANSPGVNGTTAVDLDLETCNCTNSEPNLLDLANTGEFVALFNGSTGPPTFADGIIFGTPTGSDAPSGNTTITSSAVPGCSAVTVDIGANAAKFATVDSAGGGAARTTDGGGTWISLAWEDLTPNGANDGSSLPVELINFEAKFSEGDVRLLWETLSEKDNQYFIIEHSEDGDFFTEIGREIGAGTTSSNQDYTFIHKDVSKGIHYYRLKQVDFDEKIEYSIIRFVNATNVHENNIKVFPTLVKNNLTIQSSNSFGKKSSYIIFDISGRKVGAGILEEEDNSLELNTSHWQSGYFVIQIIQGVNRTSKRIIK